MASSSPDSFLTRYRRDACQIKVEINKLGHCENELSEQNDVIQKLSIAIIFGVVLFVLILLLLLTIIACAAQYQYMRRKRKQRRRRREKAMREGMEGLSKTAAPHISKDISTAAWMVKTAGTAIVPTRKKAEYEKIQFEKDGIYMRVPFLKKKDGTMVPLKREPDGTIIYDVNEGVLTWQMLRRDGNVFVAHSGLEGRPGIKGAGAVLNDKSEREIAISLKGRGTARSKGGRASEKGRSAATSKRGTLQDTKRGEGAANGNGEGGKGGGAAATDGTGGAGGGVDGGATGTAAEGGGAAGETGAMSAGKVGAGLPTTFRGGGTAAPPSQIVSAYGAGAMGRDRSVMASPHLLRDKEKKGFFGTVQKFIVRELTNMSVSSSDSEGESHGGRDRGRKGGSKNKSKGGDQGGRAVGIEETSLAGYAYGGGKKDRSVYYKR